MLSIQPTEYVSPSGRFRLGVRPSSRSGAGGAHYRLLDGDREVWARERPLTLLEVVIADDGTAAGYGSAEGCWSQRRQPLVLQILGPDGAVRLQESSPACRSASPAALPRPPSV